MEHYIIPPDQFRPANAYNEWKAVVGAVDTLPEAVARASTWEKCDYKNTLTILRAIMKHHAQAQVYLWRHDIWKMATDGTDVAFEGAEFAEEDVPDRIQYWSLNIDVGLNEASQRDLQVSADFVMAGLFLIPMSLIRGGITGRVASPPAFVTGLLLQAGPELNGKVKEAMEAGQSPPPEEWFYRFRFGKPIHTGEVASYADQGTLAAIRFLKEKFVEPQQQFLPRADRRREEKEGRFIPEIRTILLRARSEDATSKMTDEQRREYACHFLVSSHWRRPNRRMKEQRPVFVPAYVKGDMEKPFRPPRETIYRVAR